MDTVVPFAVVAAVLLAVVVADSVMRFRNNAIGCDGKVVMTRSGGLRVTSHYIRTDAVQSIAATSGIFQRPRKVASYRVDFHAPALRNIAVVPHMNDDILQELYSHLK